MRKAAQNTGGWIDWTEHGTLTDLDFADDLALLGTTQQYLQQFTNLVNENAAKVGLRINCAKTKSMRIQHREDQPDKPLSINNKDIEDVQTFTYLGSVITPDGGADTDVKCRIGKAATVFNRLWTIWASRSISTELKIRLYNSIVLPTALYACETWKRTASIAHKIDVFHQRCLRRILRISYRDHVTNEEVLRRAKSNPLSSTVTERRLKFAGHTLRRPGHCHANVAMKWIPPGGKRKRGRPKKTWRRTFDEDLRQLNIEPGAAEKIAMDRVVWRELAARCALLHGRT